MKILVTGTEGYIGCLLTQILVAQGHEVMAIDTGFYKSGWLYNGTKITADTQTKDIRHLEQEHFDGVDAVVHMAELSNDPTGQLAPKVTREINHAGSVRLATLAKQAGVSRFVYTSSCSVYGIATEANITETSAVNPQTTYAECKVKVEKDVQALADDSFSPTFLRNATAFGASPRMRFDIVLNNLAGLAWTTREIRMTSDGTPWRPLVHVLDICKAIACTLKAPRDLIHNQIFNVGDSAQNYQVRQIAEMIADVFSGCSLSFGDRGSDNRSYRVSFEKINQQLPGFRCDWSAERGAKQLYDVFSQIDLTTEDFEHRCFTRLNQLEYLLRTQQINGDFFWRYSP